MFKVKIRAEELFKNKNKLSFKKTLVTGSDEALVNYTKNFIISHFKEKNFFINYSGKPEISQTGSLFSNKPTLFLANELPENKKNPLSDMFNDCFFLVISANVKKSSLLRSKFLKLKDSLIVECYELSRRAKEGALRHFLENKKIDLSNDVFWYIVDNFENSYAVFINQLQTLALYGKKIEQILEIENITFIDNRFEINKIFFNIFKNNKILTNIFIKNISSISDFYIFLNSIKFYLNIVSESQDVGDALKKFPSYLFAEKDIFLKIYKNLTQEKQRLIYNNLYRAEKMARTNPNLYSVFGLRFFLSIKKTITS